MMKRAESLEELKEQIKSEVYGLFKGMDNEYKQIIKKYKNAQFDGRYSAEYLAQLRKESIDSIQELLKKRKELAFNKLDEINGLYGVVEEITPAEVTGSEAQLIETRRANAMKLIDAKIKFSKSINDTFLELIETYENDEFLVQYLDALSESLPETSAILLQRRFEDKRKNPFSSEVKRNKAALTTLLSPKATQYPSYLENGIDGKNTYRSREIAADLDLNERIEEGWKNEFNVDQSGVN